MMAGGTSGEIRAAQRVDALPSPRPAGVARRGFWLVAGSIAAAAAPVAYLLSQGSADPSSLLLAAVLCGGIGYFALNSLTASLHAVRAPVMNRFRSFAFVGGGVVGLAVFLYTTVLGPAAVMGWQAFEVELHRIDGAAAAVLLLKAVGHVVAGGLLVEILSRRLFGARQAESGEKNAR